MELVKHEVALGEYGAAGVSLTSDAKVKVYLAAEIDLLAELSKLAAKTETKLDDAVVGYIKGLIEAANALEAKA